jgi:hypothetical protein
VTAKVSMDLYFGPTLVYCGKNQGQLSVLGYIELLIGFGI